MIIRRGSSYAASQTGEKACCFAANYKAGKAGMHLKISKILYKSYWISNLVMLHWNHIVRAAQNIGEGERAASDREWRVIT